MAPEIVNKKQYSYGVDVWALGILLYKIITGMFPFRGKISLPELAKIKSAQTS